jgi:hypothetical protein
MPNHIGASAEPVHSLLYLFLLSSIYVWGTPLGIPVRPIEARRPSGIFDPRFRLTVVGGSMVASVADRASQRPKNGTSQGLFQARAATGLSAVLAAERGEWRPPGIGSGDRLGVDYWPERPPPRLLHRGPP